MFRNVKWILGYFILEIPDGFPERDNVKNDMLDSWCWRLVFKDNKIVYRKIIDNKLENTYIYYIDGTNELIEDG